MLILILTNAKKLVFRISFFIILYYKCLLRSLFREYLHMRSDQWLHLLKKEREREEKKKKKREDNLNKRVSFGNKWGILKCFGRVVIKKRSAQSSWCSSLTTNACPKPSICCGLCQNFFSSLTSEGWRNLESPTSLSPPRKS